MKIKNLLRNSWTELAKIIVPTDASTAQYDDMEKCFYSGAVTVVGLHRLISTPEVSEEEGVAILQSVLEECQEFGKELNPKDETGNP